MALKVRAVRLSSANANKQIQDDILPTNPRFPAGGFVQIHAFAKINLFLDVVGKRPDGYHDLVSVMQSLELSDELTFFAAEGSGAGVFLEAESNNFPQGFPLDDSNLIIKAAKLLTDEFQIRQPIKIRLRKRIPMGAGLGGGSSNCAATLHGLNKLFALNIPLHRLMEIGRELGADVPFCLMGGTALAQGIGEELTPLPPHPSCHVVLACPDIHVSTGEIFGRLDLSKKSPTHEKFMAAYETGHVRKIAENFFNIFTPVTSAIHPQISFLINELKNFGALGTSMTGTGSTVFAYFENETNAREACNKIKVKTFLTAPKLF